MGCFVVLKKLYSDEVQRLMRDRVNYINKYDFLRSYKAAYIQAFNSRNIYSSFAGIGLVPYDLERVLLKLNTELRTPTPPLIQG